MSSNIVKCDDVVIDKINYTKPEKNGQSYFSSISYGDSLNPFYIQTPKLVSKTNISDMVGKKVPYLDVEVPSGKMNIYDFLLSLDDNNIKTTVKESEDWFGKEIPLQAIDDMYRRTTKPFKKNTAPHIRLRLPLIKNEIKCGVYNQNRIFIGTDEVKEGSEVVLILHIRGLKILKNTYYCDCYITQIKLFQEKESKFNIIKDYSILDDEDEEEKELGDIFSEEIYNSFQEEENNKKLKEKKKADAEKKKLMVEEEKRLAKVAAEEEEEEKRLAKVAAEEKEKQLAKVAEEKRIASEKEEEEKKKSEEEAEKKRVAEMIEKKKRELLELESLIN
tara:strand:- start:48 stop:1046 length:999 start_codon:yes stop_codon:yes gene_type:complete